ncbi:MAG: hypothetical protein JO266_04965 [Acidobacteria bacterium]|nr:hypothetical protein [Acidobacteriota bacterium]
MIGKKQIAEPLDGLSQYVRRVVLAELPAWQLLVLAAATGFIWAASIFDWNFIIGRSAFWQFPKGTISGSEYDMAQVLVGYLYYVQSSWHLPLFNVSQLGTPTGTNVIFMDVVPVVALLGKLIHSITARAINIYGAYLFLCFSLPGVMMMLVLIAARVRYALAAVIAAIFSNSMPALLWQWGHIALMAQFIVIGALALYLFSLNNQAWHRVLIIWITYLIIAYFTNAYLFVMVGVVWLCTILQRRLNGYATTREVLGIGALTVALVMTSIILGGLFGGGTAPPFGRGYGVYSMNLLSPFVPQESGIFSRTGGIIDATGGQYEGFNYLGIGLLIASLFVLPKEVSWLGQNVRRHISLLIAFVGLTAFAISNHVFAGHFLLLDLPIPPYVYWTLGIFRSGGRFFWLIGYAQIAVALVLGFRRAQPVVVLCLMVAAILQLFDIQPLREQIIASIAAGPETYELKRDELEGMLVRARHVEVVPSFNCAEDVKDELLKEKIRRANMELMLTAARMNVPTNTVFTGRQSFITLKDVLPAPSQAPEILKSRRTVYCRQEMSRARSGARSGELLVLLSGWPRQVDVAAGVTCSPLAWARYCERLNK